MNYAFYGCSNLEIILPDNISIIGKDALTNVKKVRANRGTKTPLAIWNSGYENYIYYVDKENFIFLAPELKATKITQTTVTWTLENASSGYQYYINEIAITGTSYSETVTGLRPELWVKSPYLKVTLDDVTYTKSFSVQTDKLNVRVNNTNTTASSISLKGAYLKGDAEIESVSLSLLNVNGKTVNVDSALFTGLYPGGSYTAKYVVKVKYGNNQTYDYTATETIKTAALTMTTAQPKVVSEGNAIIAADTNLDDAETNVGFEWRREDWSSTFA